MPIFLVTFVYADTLQSYSERVSMSKREAALIRRIVKRVAHEGRISDVYVGREQTEPTPFATFYPTLLTALNLTPSESPPPAAR